MSVLVINFICVCLVVAGGWIFSNAYAQEYYGMTIFETFSVVRGLTHSTGDFIDNAYTDTDEQVFYDSLGEALLLSPNTVKQDEVKSTVTLAISDTDNAQEIFTQYALSVLKAENFDMDKIEDVTDDTSNNLKIADREIAAFVSGMVDNVLNGALKTQLPSQEISKYGVDLDKLDLSGIVKMEQLKLYEQERTIDEELQTVNMATVTVGVDFDSLLATINDSFDAEALASTINIGIPSSLINVGAKLVVGLAKLILPSNLYLTLDMGLSHNVEPMVYINDMDAEKMDKLFNVLGKFGIELKPMLNDLFVGEGAVAKGLDSVNASAPLDQILTDGGIDCDLYQFVIDLTKINYDKETQELKHEDERISSSDIYKALKLVLGDYTEYIEQLKSSDYGYKNVSFKRNDDGSLDLSSGEPVIIDQDAQYYVTSGEQLDRLIGDYEKLFLSRFSNGYGLKDEYDIQSIIQAFSSQSFDEQSVIDMFDVDKIKNIIKGEAQGVVINDKMLAALFAKMLPDLLEQNSIGADGIEIEYIYIEERREDINHHLLNVGLKLNVRSLISNFTQDQTVIALVTNILFDQMIVETAIDITLGDVQYLATSIKLNGKEAHAIEKMLAAFGVFGNTEDGYALTMADALAQMLDPVRDVIKNLDTALAGLVIEESALKLPDVYVALSKALNQGKEQGDDGYVAPDTLKDVLRLVVNEGPIADPSSEYYFFADHNAAEVAQYNIDSEQALLAELGEKYCLNFEVDGEEDYTLAEVLHILGVNKIQEPTRVDGLEVLDLLSAQSLELLAGVGQNWQQALKVNITNVTAIEDSAEGDMFTALVRQVIFSSDVDFAALGDFDRDDLLFVKLSEQGQKQYLTVAIKVNLKALLPSGEDAIQDFLSQLLPLSPSVITLKVDVTDSDEIDACQVVINDNASSSQSLIDLLDGFGVSLDLDGIGESIRSAVLAIDDTLDVQFTDGAMMLPNVFALIDEVALGNMYDDGGAKIKDALSGVFRSSDTILQGQTISNKEIFASNIQGTTPNADYHTFMHDFETKYFLSEEAAEAQTFEELYSIVHFEHFRATDLNVNGNKGSVIDSLAYTTKSIEELTPSISAGDLGALFNERLPSDFDIELHSMDISDNKLILNFALPLNTLFEAGGDFEKLITVQTLFAHVSVNLLRVEEENEEEYYKCDIDINNMSEEQQQTLLDIVGHFTSTSQDMHSLELEIGTWIKKGFAILDDSYGESNYDVTDDGIVLRDVFTFLKMNILGQESDIAPEQIKAAIQGMYHSIPEVYNQNNYHVDVVVKNAFEGDPVASNVAQIVEKITSDGSILDRDLGAYVAAKMPEQAKLMQMSILAANPSQNSNQAEDRSFFNDMIDRQMADDKTYIIMTAEISIHELADDEEGTEINENAQIILDDFMLATFVFEYENEEFKYFDFALNEMNTQIRYVLKEITGLDIEHAMGNMEEVAQEYLGSVNDLFVQVENVAATLPGMHITHVFQEANVSTARGKYSITLF